ncbi:sigma-70 family RNA polymerase sigma factor [Bacillus salacetis]|uniref:sigma-70 family RNA polymerase sigma factor n=1 Tax=Bacillus salacetis TaxID=2315464 RepID=UPI003B9F5137
MKAKLSRTCDAGNQLLEIYPKLKSYCCNLTKNKWDGEDLAQETMLKVLNSYKVSERKLDTGLFYTIARNHWVDIVRKRSRETIVDGFPSESSQKDSSALEVSHQIEKLLKNFTLQQTVIFLLKDVFHYSNREISDAVSLTEGAVKASLFRMRTRLKTGILDGEVPVSSVWVDKFVKGIINDSPADIIQILTDNRKTGSSSVSSVHFSHFSNGKRCSYQQNPVLAA